MIFEFSGPSMSSAATMLNDVPSMPVEMSSLRAQREGNRATVELSLQHLEKADMKQQLCEIQEVLRNKCTGCLLGGHDADHPSLECTGISKGWGYTGSSFKTWRSTFKFPSKHCYHCGMPQVIFIPSNLKRP